MPKDYRTHTAATFSAKASAKVAIQTAKLAAMLPDDPQRKNQLRILRALEQNAAVARVLALRDPKS